MWLPAASQSNGVMSPMTVQWKRLWIGNVGVSMWWKHWQRLIGGYNVVLEHSFLCLSGWVALAPYMLSNIYRSALHTHVGLVLTMQSTSDFIQITILDKWSVHTQGATYVCCFGCGIEPLIIVAYANVESLLCFIFRGGGAQTTPDWLDELGSLGGVQLVNSVIHSNDFGWFAFLSLCVKHNNLSAFFSSNCLDGLLSFIMHSNISAQRATAWGVIKAQKSKQRKKFWEVNEKKRMMMCGNGQSFL